MALYPACTLSQLPPGELADVTVNGVPIALCNVDGVVHAVDGVCPHRNAPLGQGALNGKMIVCPWHAWEFDCTDGQYDYNPEIRLRTFPVKVNRDDIFVELP